MGSSSGKTLTPAPLPSLPPPSPGEGKRTAPNLNLTLFFSLFSPEGWAEGREKRAGVMRVYRAGT